jgi:predicted nucleic acid-binding protein
MNGFALDTNIISYVLRGNAEVMKHIAYEETQGVPVVIPPIVYYETKRGLILSHAFTKLSAFERFCIQLGVVDMDRTSLDCAILIYADLRQRGRPIGDADILILVCGNIYPTGTVFLARCRVSFSLAYLSGYAAFNLPCLVPKILVRS